MTEAAVFVDIADVVPSTQKVEAHDLKPGDILFSVFGHQKVLTSVRVLKSGWVSVKFEGETYREHLPSKPYTAIVKEA